MKIESYDKKNLEKILREGAVTEFWTIIKQAIDENIEELERVFLKEILNGSYDCLSAEECRVQLLTFKEKRRQYEQLKLLPFDIVQSITEPAYDNLVDDVYARPEDFLPKEKY